MKDSTRLAIAVLLEEGLIEKDGQGYAFVKAKESSKEVATVSKPEIVTPDWLQQLATKSVQPIGDYVPRTPAQRLMCAYKIAKGIAFDDAGWDKHQFMKWSKSCIKLLDAFEKNDRGAAYWLQDFAARMDGDGLDWNLATAASYAWDEKGKREVA